MLFRGDLKCFVHCFEVELKLIVAWKGVNRTKSGIMLGFGEKKEEVVQTIKDLRKAKVDVVTIGQYLQPSKKHLPVKNFVDPTEFNFYKKFAEDLGFVHVESGPLVRSSYKAQKHIT